jgi:hypothetical protein
LLKDNSRNQKNFQIYPSDFRGGLARRRGGLFQKFSVYYIRPLNQS